MSTKRILGITAISILLIVVVIGFMLIDFVFGSDVHAIILPQQPIAAPVQQPHTQYEVGRIEVTRENAQAVISTLSRLHNYSRNVRVTTYWEGGQADFYFNVTVYGDAAAIFSNSQAGPQRHIIIANNRQFIWHTGDSEAFDGYIDALGSAERAADEWQMLVTFEDVLDVNPDSILAAGHILFEGVSCIYVTYRTELLGFLRTYYISIEHGLVVAAFEYDQSGFMTYQMIAGAAASADLNAFLLPDGTNVLNIEVHE